MGFSGCEWAMKPSKTDHEKKLVSKEDLPVLNMCLIAKTFVVKTSENCGYFAHFLSFLP